MSLLSEAMENCIMLDKTTTDDGYGGISVEWKEGASFSAAIVFDTSIQARIAAQEGVTSRYTVTTAKAVTLQFNDYFKRLSDGKMFKVTSDGDDRFTPNSSSLDMRQVEAAEVVSLPR